MLKVNLLPFPTLKTERLIMREIVMEDAYDFFIIRSNKEIMSAIDREPIKTIEEIKTFIELLKTNLIANKGIAWALCLKANNKMIGHFGFHQIDEINHRAEIGYALLPEFQGLGYAHEALTAMLEFAFIKFNFHSIEANINPTNSHSIKLVEKCCFVKEAHFKENYYCNGVFLDSAIYSVLKSNYLKQ